VDRYGNVNSTMILDRETGGLKTMLPGSGGANDIATSAKRTIIIMRSTRRCFVEKVDYITSPGYLDGPGCREKYGMPGGGPEIVISAEGTFRFDPETKEMYLATYHPGVSVEEIREMVPWDLKVSSDVRETEPPTEEEIEILRLLDPSGMYVGSGKKILKEGEQGNFGVFLQNMLDSFEPMGRFVKRYD
jgi:glutaconate coA-transferase